MTKDKTPARPKFIKHAVENAEDWSEWVCPDPKSYLMKCCDCGLVHEMQFKVVRYKSKDEREECDVVGDPNLQAVFRMRRSEEWSPKDTAYRPGGLAQPELTLDGLTPTEFALRELYEFQEATGCDTAAEFKAQPEGCQCPACKVTPHASDCAVHNEPAYPKGACNCGAKPEQEPVAWRNAALRVGEDLCSVGPFGYYDMTAKQWLDWALSVVTVHAPQPPQRKPLTDAELRVIENKINPNMRWRSSDEEGITLYPQEYYELVKAIEAAHGIKE